MDEFILIADDDSTFIDELRKQVSALPEWQDRCLIVCFDKDNLPELLNHYADQITVAFLDFDLRYQDDKAFGAAQFMESTKDYLNWNATRCFWFSGDEDLDQNQIQKTKEKFTGLNTSYIRKPFTFKQLIARLTSDFKLSEQWHNFPQPLRVINKDADVVYANHYWKNSENMPDPKLFIHERKFKQESREFYGPYPGIDSNTSLSHFRLLSFMDDSQQFLLQFAEGLVGLEEAKKHTLLQELIVKITTALQGHGFSRIRLYRYYSIPQSYENMEENQSQDITGFMSLYYTNTALRYNKAGIQNQKERGQCDCCATLDRGKRIKQKIDASSKSPEVLLYDIDTNPAPTEICDLNTIPKNAVNTQSVLELPLITSSKEIINITKQKLLGLLVIDSYDKNNKRYVEITDDNIARLEHTLMAYCKELTASLEQEIKETNQKDKLEYADLDQPFLQKLDSPDSLLKDLLDKAINAVDADVGYLTERSLSDKHLSDDHPSDSYKITVATDHKLFHGYVFSSKATALPVVRCWQNKMRVALPNLKKDIDIQAAIVKAYQNEQMVWHCDGINTNVASKIKSYLEKNIGSLIALPVFAENEQISAIILHSKKSYHFDYEKLNRLECLTTRVGWILIVARRMEQRKLFLDGVVHEIKTDLSPLKHALNSLKINDEQHNIYLRAQYCTTRLDMAVKNLLLMVRDTEFKLDKSDCLFNVLPKLCELYAEECSDKNITLCFTPELENHSVWATPITMSVEWLTHIIANLLDNAVKYTKPNKTVLISAKIEKEQIVLTVTNPGRIKKDDRTKVFDPDYRSKKGTGFHVGLASCKKVMQAHQGDIDLKNCDSKIHATVTWSLKITTGENS